MSEPWVSIVMGSHNDLDHLRPGTELLRRFEVPFEVRVLSAHRTPAQVAEWASGLKERGVRVVIAAAGWSAALAGVCAAHTTLPVIGVPIPSSPLSGLDAILSTLQMPGGVPVAAMSLGSAGAKNAAIFATQIIGLSEKRLADALAELKKEQAEGVLEKDERVRGEFAQ